ELSKERMTASLKRQVEANTLKILAELEHTIRQYGKEHGYTYIFKIDEGAPDDGKGTTSEFQERIFRAQISDVIYADPGEDVTAAVLAVLNSPENLERVKKVEPKRRSY